MTRFASCALRFSGDGPLLLDSSAAVAFLTPGHPGYLAVREFVDGSELGLAGHAAFETYSVLTRMPLSQRPTGAQIREIIRHNFPETRYLSPEGQARLWDVLAAARLSGGQVYDALVAAAAVEADLPLVSRDRRAAVTYRAVGARFELL